MKKLFIFMVMLFALCGAVSAAEQMQPIDGKYSVSYHAGTENAGKRYTIIAIEGLNVQRISSEGVVYINEAVCSSDGYVTIASLEPLKVCDCTFFIGGGHLESPVVYGTIVVPNYGGRVISYGNKPATLKVYSAGTLVETAATDAAGSYSLKNVLKGKSYDIVITKNGYLSYTFKVTLGEQLTLPDADIREAAGDLDGSGKILYRDLLAFMAQLGKASTDSAADFDCDGNVDVDDLEILIKNYNRQDIVKNG